MAMALLFLGGVVGATTGNHHAATTVSNAHFRTDKMGLPFDAHDGSTQQFEEGGPYFYHAMGYGTCLEDGKQAEGGCGQTSNNTVGVWRSDTLAHGSWELLSSFEPSAAGWPKCTYFRSHALRSAATGKYVLWLNAQSCWGNTDGTGCPNGSANKCFAVGTSDSPTGPFMYQGIAPDVRYITEGGTGDFGLFQDDDDAKTSYIIYKRSGAAPGNQAHRMTLQQLRPDLLGAVPGNASSAGVFGAVFVEAPAMFKRQGVYYSLFGQCCAFCAHGTGIGVYTATHPLGPWVEQAQIGCAEKVPLGCGCGMPLPGVYNTSCRRGVAATTFAQQNSVIVTGGGDFVWTGDRWQSACANTVASQGLPKTGLPPGLDCVKAYDLQYWSTLKWSDGTPPLPAQVVFEDEIEFRV